MIGALITFFVLFILIKTFERDREDLESFSIGMVAGAPIIAVVLVQIALGLVVPNSIFLLILPPIVLIGVTFFLLWKNLEISKGRSAGYTFAVVLVNEVLRYFLVSN